MLAINLETEFRTTFFEQFSIGLMRGVDGVAQIVLSLGFEFKAITLFSTLFGVGLAIQFERLAGNSRRTALLVRRLLVLLGFGLIHLFLIWNGDILTEYAIAGLMVLPLLYAPRWVSLAAAGALFLMFLFMAQLPLPWSFPDQAWMTQHIAQARSVYRHGSFAQVAAFRISEVPYLAPYLAYVFPRTMALMLFGAWIWRGGLLRRLRERARPFLGWAAVMIGSGLLLTLEQYGFVSVVRSSATAENLVDGIAPVVLAFGYAALMLGVSGSARVQWLLAWFAPVGRMAFTNYIAQSVTLTLLFYGFGLGLMGRVGPAAGLGIAVAIYAVQAVISRWWLEQHRFGPLEWLWRTLMYGELQPWRRRGVASSVAPAGALP